MSRRRLIVAAGVIAILLVPVAVLAGHRFNDVPASHTFHNDIDWLAEEGITRGCNPPANNQFCPDDPVTRGAMAAFMKRFHDRFIDSQSSVVGLGVSTRSLSEPPSTGNGIVSGLELALRIPEAGILVIQASVAMENTTHADVFACGINAGGSASQAVVDSWRNMDLSTNSHDTCSTMSSFQVTPGDRVVRVIVAEALSSTQATGGVLAAVLYTSDGAFDLAGNDAAEQVEMGPLSDAPKGS